MGVYQASASRTFGGGSVNPRERGWGSGRFCRRCQRPSEVRGGRCVVQVSAVMGAVSDEVPTTGAPIAAGAAFKDSVTVLNSVRSVTLGSSSVGDGAHNRSVDPGTSLGSGPNSSLISARASRPLSGSRAIVWAPWPPRECPLPLASSSPRRLMQLARQGILRAHGAAEQERWDSQGGTARWWDVQSHAATMPRCITRSPTTSVWSARCKTHRLSHITTSPGDQVWR